MYVVTNREVRETKSGEPADLDIFGKKPNRDGPNELRIVRVERDGNDWAAETLKDELLVREARALRDQWNLDINPSVVRHASLKVACELYEQTQTSGRNLAVYVHGYNNDIRDVVETAEAIEQQHGVICVVFSWPANGGGPVSGTVAYRRDKKDARASMDALNRFFEKMQFFHEKLTAGMRERLREVAAQRHPDNPDRTQALYAKLCSEQCETKLSLICHSMGNYVLKYALRPSMGGARALLFDNVCLVAADTNNAGHDSWVGSLDVRNRVYVFINEHDFALKWSRRKPGEEQLPRLGHYIKNLSAANAFYIDVTRAGGVGEAHGYFVGEVPAANEQLKQLFTAALNGGSPESAPDSVLRFAADLNLYRLVGG
ncbi:alpha/beta hydrolase [Thiohalocapsa sp.]|jgi:esterase/lipase superfamily enzyme|uniref:alpha/beta hydrolase n=1 Tax=Thiohalocapsa sp. TaxID=2497641 RepID=UPI0025E5A979|nr:alpha/beta hydrolase [Thiohalocapsa sp.]